MVDANEGKRAISAITFATCKSCGATVSSRTASPSRSAARTSSGKPEGDFRFGLGPPLFCRIHPINSAASLNR